MQANDFLIALRMRAEHGAIIKKLCDFKERHKTKETESIAALLTGRKGRWGSSWKGAFEL
jgi:hypothetical protein